MKRLKIQIIIIKFKNKSYDVIKTLNSNLMKLKRNNLTVLEWHS